ARRARTRTRTRARTHATRARARAHPTRSGADGPESSAISGRSSRAGVACPSRRAALRGPFRRPRWHRGPLWARLWPMAKSKGPLIALTAIVTISLGLTAWNLLRHSYTVTAADGSTVTIETDPARIAAKFEGPDDSEGMRKYGVSEKAQAELPESS